MSSKPLRVASVGLGWVTTNRHLPTMAASSDFELVGMVDKAPGRAEAVAKEYGCKHFSEASDLSAIDWLDEVDAVTIGTSPFSHHALVTAALNLGKHVITEKPFAMTVEEGEEMASLAEEKGLILAVVHNFQFAQSTQRMERDINSGRMGRIRGIVGWQLGNPNRRLPDWFEELPLGLYYDESPHLFYLLKRFAPGPLEMESVNVFPSTVGKVTPSSVEAVYSSTDGTNPPIPVRLSLNFESPVSEWHLTVLGENELGDADVFRDIYIRLPDDGDHTSKTVVRTSVMTTWQHWIQHFPNGLKHVTGKMRYGNETVFGRFAEAARTGVPPKDISARDALEVLKLQHELIEKGAS